MVVPAADWFAKKPPRKPMGQWLVDNIPRGVNLNVSGKRESGRDIPFSAAKPA